MKIFCIGRNYADHAKELNNKVPTEPLIFMKPSTAYNNKDFLFYPDFTKELHFEAELVLKSVKNGKFIDQKYASDYYEQVGFGIDFTARDLQKSLKEKGHPWEKAKGFDGSAPVGGYVDVDKTKDNINFRMLKNGKEIQNGNSRDMIFSFDYLISYISRYFTIQLGDLIFTGTPAGVGAVQIGDHLEGFIENEKLLDFTIK